jgi:hypothetical protein
LATRQLSESTPSEEEPEKPPGTANKNSESARIKIQNQLLVELKGNLPRAA